MKQYLIDTQFLFGLRESDKHFPKVKYILDNLSSYLLVPSIAFFEVQIVTMAQGKTNHIIQKLISYLNQEMKFHSIREIAFNSAIQLKALELRDEFTKLSLFDSLVLSTAIFEGCQVLSDDKFLHKIRPTILLTLQNFIDLNSN